MTAARKTRKRASSAKEAAPVHTRIETGSFDAPFRSLRLSRPDGATIVLNVPDVQGVEDYFARVRAWFDERPEELALFGLLDPYQQSKRDLIAFADQSQTKIPLAPPSKVELRLEIVNDIGPSRDSAPPGSVAIRSAFSSKRRDPAFCLGLSVPFPAVRRVRSPAERTDRRDEQSDEVRDQARALSV
jgi:hypothetical protein